MAILSTCRLPRLPLFPVKGNVLELRYGSDLRTEELSNGKHATDGLYQSLIRRARTSLYSLPLESSIRRIQGLPINARADFKQGKGQTLIAASEI